MIYTPQKHPKQSFILISIMSLGGISLGYLVDKVFILICLLFWMQYTAVLSYIQFKKKSRHGYHNFTEILLHPQLRFFLFEFMAVISIGALIKYGHMFVGAIALMAWWIFSLNFYLYYKPKKKRKI